MVSGETGDAADRLGEHGDQNTRDLITRRQLWGVEQPLSELGQTLDDDGWGRPAGRSSFGISFCAVAQRAKDLAM